MSSFLLLVLAAVSTTYFPELPLIFPKTKEIMNDNVRLIKEAVPDQLNDLSLNDVQLMLQQDAPGLNPLVVNKVLTVLKCVIEYHVIHNNILTIIDYSLPSNQKRLWVFDLKGRKLLFYTYVSHGIKSGALMTNYFSNKFNSKASSIGVYQTQKAYYGRDGLSLRLDGLDQSFNDNVSNRSVVMHSGWYVDERFIKKYGRPGRSWGCPALPLEDSQAIINTIKDKSLMIIYYPSDVWFAKSKFLNCNKSIASQYINAPVVQTSISSPDEKRDAILSVGNGYQKSKYVENNPIAVLATDKYERIFHAPVPLSRMLRRQINQEEYIALSTNEMNYLIHNNLGITDQNNAITEINFVIPILKEVHPGYYETQMQIVDLGKIKEIKPKNNLAMTPSFIVIFDGKPAVNLEVNNKFIRWLGL